MIYTIAYIQLTYIHTHNTQDIMLTKKNAAIFSINDIYNSSSSSNNNNNNSNINSETLAHI